MARQAMKIVLILGSVVVFAACNSVTPEPTPTATSLPTSTPLPSSTITPNPTATSTPTVTSTSTATQTPNPTDTPAPSPTHTKSPKPATPTTIALPLPTGQPAPSWNGVPIMPQASSGTGDQGGYSYTVNATVQQVQDFYDREMPKVGWQPFATGTGETGNLLLMYQKDGRITTVGVIAQGDVIHVIIVQS